MGNIQLFKDQKIRSHWDAEEEKWYFSIVDVVSVLTESTRARKYWNALKTKLKQEGSELSQFLGQLKMQSEDGKFYMTDVADTEQLLRTRMLAMDKLEMPDEANNAIPEWQKKEALSRLQAMHENPGMAIDWGTAITRIKELAK